MTTTIELAEILERTIKYKHNETDEVCTQSLHIKPTEIQCREAAQRLRELDKPDCVWTYDNEQFMYDTGCGNYWSTAAWTNCTEKEAAKIALVNAPNQEQIEWTDRRWL